VTATAKVGAWSAPTTKSCEPSNRNARLVDWPKCSCSSPVNAAESCESENAFTVKNESRVKETLQRSGIETPIFELIHMLQNDKTY